MYIAPRSMYLLSGTVNNGKTWTSMFQRQSYLHMTRITLAGHVLTENDQKDLSMYILPCRLLI